MTTTTAADPTMRRAYLAVGVAGLIFAVGAGSFLGLRAGISVVLGALVALANLWVLEKTVRNLLGGAQVKWGAVAVLKFIVLLVVTFGLVRSGFVLPLGLALGFGALPFGIFAAGTFGVPADPADSSPVNPSSSQETDHA